MGSFYFSFEPPFYAILTFHRLSEEAGPTVRGRKENVPQKLPSWVKLALRDKLILVQFIPLEPYGPESPSLSPSLRSSVE
jgi:hypothetical protein